MVLDISCSESLDALLWRVRPQTVIHLAGSTGVRCPDQSSSAIDNNLSSTDALLRSMHRNGVRRLVFASSSSVYGRGHSGCGSTRSFGHPLSDYALSKQICEAMCSEWQKNSDANAVVLRIFTTYGPGARSAMAVPSFLNAMMTGQPLMLNGSGRPRRDFVHVYDVCRGIIAALAVGPMSGTYDVGTGESTSTAEVVKMIAGMLSVSPVVHIRDADPRDMLMTRANVSPAAEELGFRASMCLAAGLLETTRGAIDVRRTPRVLKYNKFISQYHDQK